MTSTPFPLGRIAQFDNRSRNFSFTPSIGGPKANVMHHVWGKRLNQGDTGSCTGNATVGARNTSPNHKPRDPIYDEMMARKVYALATTLDDIPGTWNEDGTGEDTGSSGLAAMKAGVKLGLLTSYQWCFGLDHMLLSLNDRPVCVGTNWYEDMFNPDSSGLVKVGGSLAGGHEWEIRGQSLEHRVFFGVQSWGDKWGVHGLFTISFDDVNRLLNEDGDVKVPIR